MSVLGLNFVKWIVATYKGWINIIYDVACCCFLAIPLLWSAALKSFFPKRKKVHGKLVAIIGAGSKLSRSVAFLLAHLGCHIALVDLHEDNSEHIIEELKLKGCKKAKLFHTDITHLEAIKKLRDEIEQQMGTVDILINAADVRPFPGKKTKPGFIELMLEVNLFGTIQASRVFREQMRNKNGGHIVSIASLSGIHPSQFTVTYAATKAGVVHFMASFREKLRMDKLDTKIKTTCICPYFIQDDKDELDLPSHDLRFPPIKLAEATHKIVDAILKEETFITIPSYYKPSLKFLQMFPLTVQHLIRDRVLREPEMQFMACD